MAGCALIEDLPNTAGDDVAIVSSAITVRERDRQHLGALTIGEVAFLLVLPLVVGYGVGFAIGAINRRCK